MDASSICLRCMVSITGILLLYVSNLWRVFSKCSFRQHSAQFHSALYPSFRRKNPHSIFRKLPFDNFPHSAIRKIPLPVSKHCLQINISRHYPYWMQRARCILTRYELFSTLYNMIYAWSYSNVLS